MPVLCGNWIYVNKGELITEDKFHYLFWMMYLPNLGITEQIFEAYRDKLTKKFKTISVRDTVWYILNFMVRNYPFSEYSMLVYYELARMAAMEQRDAQEYIELMLRTQLVINKIKKVKTVRVVCVMGMILNKLIVLCVPDCITKNSRSMRNLKKCLYQDNVQVVFAHVSMSIS